MDPSVSPAVNTSRSDSRSRSRRCPSTMTNSIPPRTKWSVSAAAARRVSRARGGGCPAPIVRRGYRTSPTEVFERTYRSSGYVELRELAALPDVADSRGSVYPAARLGSLRWLSRGGRSPLCALGVDRLRGARITVALWRLARLPTLRCEPVAAVKRFCSRTSKTGERMRFTRRPATGLMVRTAFQSSAAPASRGPPGQATSTVLMRSACQCWDGCESRGPLILDYR